uniref:Uncharacterized protein n=1 Tax=Hyaloperonospora arabidopsidis (strain Emoy2) TaxID=559515 RepID=M4BA46_HYAAE
MGTPTAPMSSSVRNAKWLINARLDAEDMIDTIYDESDGGSVTFDDSAEWKRKPQTTKITQR